MPELEALKRQIAAVKQAIAHLDAEPVATIDYGTTLEELNADPTVVRAVAERVALLDDLGEALATLERLMPPF